MQLGMVGLGRMGANMVRRLLGKNHECIVFDMSPKAISESVKDGAKGMEDTPTMWTISGEPRSCNPKEVTMWTSGPAAG